VITSRQLRDRLGIAIEGVEHLDVEDLPRQIGRLERIRVWLMVRCFPNRLRRRVSQFRPADRAVILFTSGSEKAPKAVPLTHENVIANVQAVPVVLDLTNQDSVLGFLPMFHSFGFTMTGLCPLLGGVRTIHHADPTDTAGLRWKIAAYATKVLVGMPSLVARLLESARPEELDSLRLIVVGAEKAPPTLFETARRVVPKAVLLEGYGVTECSPAIAVNRPTATRPGSVGQPLPGVEVCVMDLETSEALPAGRMGMLLVSGPTVFPGYLGEEAFPFIDREGKRWYVTGDLGETDADGFLYFRGRLKRFVKAGGEMISLPALEEPFSLRYPPDQNGPRVAVEGIETGIGRKIVLWTTEPITLEEANELLFQAGFRGVMRLDEVHRLDRLPVLGTGKIDYRQLRTMLEAGNTQQAASSVHSYSAGEQQL
jgi:long-chain-fatty-acid--[acyl-carrier-protein] ligase